jgi:hypothetical protein
MWGEHGDRHYETNHSKGRGQKVAPMPMAIDA